MTKQYNYLAILAFILLIIMSFLCISNAQTILPTKTEIALESPRKPVVGRSWLPDTPDKVNLLADAIYWAEGGENASTPFGIKQTKHINCEGYDECRKICKNTIRNNIIRWKDGDGSVMLYLIFLKNRYCPITGKLTENEQAMNGYWLNNVMYFLNNPKPVVNK